MIYFYSGTPGSGKSLHMARDIWNKLILKKQPVIANFPLNLNYITKKGKKKCGNFTYVNNSELTVKFLVDYAVNNHIMGKESQTLVCIDECQVLFNPREFSRGDRLEWITFFTQHRKLGFNFILCSQFDRLVDRQIRCLFEYDIKHRKVNNYGMGMFMPVSTFVAVNYWYGVKERIGCEFFVYRKKYSKIYDSFMFFSGSIKGIENFNDKEHLHEHSCSTGEERSEGGPVARLCSLNFFTYRILKIYLRIKMKIFG